MPSALVYFFLFVSSIFAGVHSFAIATSLYWYYWWFDNLMHFWGGALVVLGVYAFCSLKHVPLKPTTVLIFGTLFTAMIVWEIFEWQVGLFDPQTHLLDTAQDILMGTIGGLCGYLLAVRLRI